jgi:hypothetical protein
VSKNTADNFDESVVAIAVGTSFLWKIVKKDIRFPKPDALTRKMEFGYCAASHQLR